VQDSSTAIGAGISSGELRGIAERIMMIARKHKSPATYEERVNLIVDQLKQLLDPSAGYTKVGETFSRPLSDRGFD
jgi:hypothetical protein